MQNGRANDFPHSRPLEEGHAKRAKETAGCPRKGEALSAAFLNMHALPKQRLRNKTKTKRETRRVVRLGNRARKKGDTRRAMFHDEPVCDSVHMGETDVAPTIVGLPWELMCAIAADAGPDAILAMACCCRHMAPLGRDRVLWRLMCVQCAFPQVLVDRLDARQASGNRVDWRHQWMARRDPAQKVQPWTGALPRYRLGENPLVVTVGQHFEYKSVACVDVHRGARMLSGATSSSSSSQPMGGIAIHIDLDPCRVQNARRPESVVTHTYANGDVRCFVQSQSSDGVPRQRTLWFRCSPLCGDPRFAGKVLYRQGWTDARVSAQHGAKHADADFVHCFFPKEDRERSFFHAYVTLGLVGWGDTMTGAYTNATGKYSLPTIGDRDALLCARPFDRNTDWALDRQRPWYAPATPKENAVNRWFQPASWARLVCPLSGEVSNDGDGSTWAILSNGSIYDSYAIAVWFDMIEAQGLVVFDPLTGEPVAPIIYIVRWWMNGINPAWVARRVVYAYRRLWTLIADGADLLTEHDRAKYAISYFVFADLIDAYCAAGILGSTSRDPDWRSHHDRCLERLAQGQFNLALPPTRSLFGDLDLECVDARDIAVPYPTPSVPPNKADDIRHMTLTRARLERVTWTDRRFDHCWFSGATFIECAFVRCRFTDCLFIEAVFDRCVFSECDFFVSRPRAFDVPVTGPTHSVLARFGCRRVILAGHTGRNNGATGSFSP